MSALNEICDPLEDVGHLSHYPQPLLHQGQQLLVLLRRGAFLQQKYNGFLKGKVSTNSTEISFCRVREIYLVGGDVVVELESFLVTLNSN